MGIKEKLDQIRAEQKRQTQNEIADNERRCRDLRSRLVKPLSSLNERIKSELPPFVQVMKETGIVDVLEDLIGEMNITYWKDGQVMTAADRASLGHELIVHSEEKQLASVEIWLNWGKQSEEMRPYTVWVGPAENDKVTVYELTYPSTEELVSGDIPQLNINNEGIQEESLTRQEDLLQGALSRLTSLNQSNVRLEELVLNIEHDAIYMEEKINQYDWQTELVSDAFSIGLAHNPDEDFVFRYGDLTLSSRTAFQNRDALESFVLQAYLPHNSVFP